MESQIFAKSDVTFDTFDVLGIPVSVTTLDKSFNAIVEWSKDDRGRFVFVRDVHGIVQAQKDERLRQLHFEAALVTPDGMPLVWTGRSRGLPVERTAGADLMSHVFKKSGGTGLKHFFYGGKEGVAKQLRERFALSAPEAEVVGCGTPPFRPLTDDELNALSSELISAGANVVWIGTSTPKQEYLASELAKRVPATFIGVGAAFDFHTGSVKRAPLWMQVNGLEWLHRLYSEPRRLWKRYLLLAPKFVFLMALQRLQDLVSARDTAIDRHPHFSSPE